MKKPPAGKKGARFADLIARADEILSGPGAKDAKLSAICSLLRKQVAHYDWVGFYLMDSTGKELLLGPFDGEPTEHVRIPVGRGICGQAAASRSTFVVQDVSKESNYLSCSLSVKSEIVVPVLHGRKVTGELDIDSHSKSAFTPEDREFLEEICRMVSSRGLV